jgi:general secretion pathway protein J
MMRRPVPGFTLIEVLLATLLLAGGLTLAFATLRSAGAISQRGEAIAQRSERMRAVEGFLRQRLSAALPVAQGMDREKQQPQYFIGEPQRMRFVADVPDYLGRGGPYLHDLKVVDDAPAQRLQLGLTMLQAGATVAESSQQPAETLVEAAEQVRFNYRGIDSESGRLGAWMDHWDAHDRLPLLVRIEVREAGVNWPPLLVMLPQAGM